MIVVRKTYIGVSRSQCSTQCDRDRLMVALKKTSIKTMDWTKYGEWSGMVWEGEYCNGWSHGRRVAMLLFVRFLWCRLIGRSPCSHTRPFGIISTTNSDWHQPSHHISVSFSNIIYFGRAHFDMILFSLTKYLTFKSFFAACHLMQAAVVMSSGLTVVSLRCNSWNPVVLSQAASARPDKLSSPTISAFH